MAAKRIRDKTKFMYHVWIQTYELLIYIAYITTFIALNYGLVTQKNKLMFKNISLKDKWKK